MLENFTESCWNFGRKIC